MNGFEKVFIMFASAFALEEYTASKEHGWTSGSFETFSTELCANATITVYIANVSSCASHKKVLQTHHEMEALERIRLLFHRDLSSVPRLPHQGPSLRQP